MEKVSDNLLLFSRNLQANGAQFFWDTLYIEYSLYHILSSLLSSLQMICIPQAIIVVSFCKNVFHKSWVKILLCFENLYHKQLQIALVCGHRIIISI